MTEEKKTQYGDPMTYPFWEAAAQHRLIIQHCKRCGSHQFYPRPFCVKCATGEVEWVETKGDGTIYSLTTVRVQISPAFNPPYNVALVQLDEGPRMLTDIEGINAKIGDRVKLTWRERTDAPPLPVWIPA
ncbi:MAG: Zn-ribbon domain-containing OB-fold protein [Dehalococcoidia bacterium]|nr:Zn-ribbon domain-containing OB-fold protein [Dehalococcoidia bacterium]